MLLPVVVAVLNAQTGGGAVQFVCNAVAQVTPTVRAEGFAELVGDIVITCTGGYDLPVGSLIPQTNLVVNLTAPVTSRLYSGQWAEPLLLIDEPHSGIQGTASNMRACEDPNGICNVYKTEVIGGDFDGSEGHPNVFSGQVNGNQVMFPGIPVAPPVTSGYMTVFRITNIRVNANALGSGGGIGVVQAYLSVSGGASLPISSSPLSVAFVQTSLTPTLLTPDASGAGSAVTVGCASGTQRLGVLNFSENFPSAFRSRVGVNPNTGWIPWVDSDTAATPQAQDIPGTLFNAESGFYAPSLTAPTVDFTTVGLADTGTRLRALIENIPPGTRVFASVNGVQFSGGAPAPVTTRLAGPYNINTVARLIQNEGQPFAAAPVTTTIEGIPAAELTVAGGTATAVWELLSTNPSANENAKFLIWVQPANAGSATVTMSYSPTYPSSSASATLPLPRFAVGAASTAQPFFTAGACAPDMSMGLTHAGDFVRNQSGAKYTLTARNLGGGATSGTVTVTDTLPAGLTATAMGGTGWDCTLSSLTCTRSDALAAGGSYPAITLTVNVDAGAPDSLLNTAAVSGGGETNTANNSSSDSTTIKTFTVAVTPGSGSGFSQTFVLQASDSAGSATISTLWAWFNASFSSSGANSCMLYYSPPQNQIYLLNDAGTAWTAAVGGSSATLANHQCSIAVSRVDTSANLNNWAVYVPVTFTPAFGGAKNVYVYASDTTSNTSWQAGGTWSVPVVTVTADSVTPSSGSGPGQTFALQYSDSAGASDLSTVWVWFNATMSSSAANSCMLYYDRAQNKVYLLDDAGKVWSPATPGTSGSLSNQQCSLDLSGATVTPSGNALTLQLPMSFTAAFNGTKNVYLYGAGSNNSGWQNRGSWTVAAIAAAVTADSVSPSSGTGGSRTFALQYTDSLGATDVSTVWVWFNATMSSSAANSCMLYYSRPLNQLYLLNDAGAAWTPATPGSAAALANHQCSVDLAGVTVTAGANTLTLQMPLTFTATFSGGKNVYLYGAGSSVNSGWQNLGTWTIPTITPAVTADTVSPSTGSGNSQTFALQLSDSLGVPDLSTAWVWFTGSFSGSGANSCMLYYSRPANQVYLLNDAGTVWTPGVPGANTSLSNHQCSVNLSGVTAAPSGNTITVQLPMTFTAAFGGDKKVYAYGSGASLSSGWQERGSWTVPVVTVSADSVSPSAGSAASQTFALQYSDSLGAADLNQFYLLNDAGTAWMPGPPGANTRLGNRPRSVDLSGVAATPGGNNLTLQVPIAFTALFGGDKNVYLYAGGTLNSGWQQRGTWAVPSTAAVTVDSVSPSSGSGATQTFALQYSDSLGVADLSTMWVWFSATMSSSAANSCMLYYNRPQNQLFLINDAGTGWIPGTPGTGATLANQQCSVNLSGVTVTPSGNSLTLRLPTTFTGAFSGGKNVYLYGAGSSLNSGWQTRGTWIVE
ncbi:MAG: DUF11 domain-containing protein [Acidobacteriia bacterium]|nr:DUF11 domain-containing protein [Terriglobia bacterium]